MFDYHIHPDYSIDAEGSIAQHCEAALAQGLTDICFTTHFDTEPEAYETDARINVHGTRVRLDAPWLPTYLQEIAAAADAYRDRGLRVRAGIEIGYHDGVVERYGALIRSLPFDFVLGSVHRIRGLAVTIGAELNRLLAREGREKALTEYYQALGAAAACGMFDCLGHVDLYRRTAYIRDEHDIEHGPVHEATAAFLAAAAERGTGIEINGRNGSAGPAYLCPGPTLLKMAVGAGIATFTIGSDAHEPTAVGAGGDVARRALLAAGIDQVATFERRKAIYRQLR